MTSAAVVRVREGRAPPPPLLDADDASEREKLSLLGQMSSSVAHELKNPLATIVATAQSLLTFWTLPGGPLHIGARQRLPAKAQLIQLREDLQLVLSEARRASDIVLSLLAFVRRQPAQVQAVSMADLLRRAALLLGHDLEVQNVRLVVTAAAGDGGPWVRGRENQLLQVLANLITNAGQALAMQRGGGTVIVECGEGENDDVVVSVEDDGPGVPAELRDQIFRPFFTTKPDGQGTGLGLPISLQIMQAHGGTLSLEDGTRGGARFVLRLPASLAGPSGVERTCPTAAPPPERAAVARVLLVDDEPGLRGVTARYLRRCGFGVDEVATGSAALAALKTAAYDAILSDMRMPGFSGRDLFDLIRREWPALAARFILVSGDLMRQETARFVEQTGCHTLEKPYELADLLTLLDQVCAPAPADPVSP
jgi:two-component system NtrC family sensor kinase